MYCEMKPIARDKLMFKAICNVDPKVNFLPNWVLNFFVRKIGTYMMEKILKLAKDIRGTEWEKSMNKPENIEFYDWVRERAEDLY